MSAPCIRCSHSFGGSLAAALDDAPAPQQAVSVWVDWGSTAATGPFTLTARHEGTAVSHASVERSHQELTLSLELEDLAHGATVVVELHWPDGARHLHLLRPLEPSCLAFSNLVSVAPSAADIAAVELTPNMAASICKMPASYWWRSVCPENPEVETLCTPTRPLVLSSVDRGLGVEIELVTVSGPGRPGRMTLVNPGLGATLDAVAERCVASSPSATATLRRCLRWAVGDDVAIRPSMQIAARRTAEACGIAAEDKERALTLLSATPDVTHKTELRSPAPPCELTFSDGAADEIRCMLQLVRRSGAAATSICRTHSTLLSNPESACDSGTAVHVHVNVRNADANGELLSARELLRVVLAWVRFDLVTSRFARAWMWREPSCTSLLATGPEFIRSSAGTIADIEDGEVPSGESPAAWEWDVPAFFVRVHALLHSAGFNALSDEEQVSRLFDCSLNLQSLIKYGTLEVRRFHSTLDGDLIANWAHLCVCFVESFRHPRGEDGGYSEETLLAMPLPDEALAALQAAQERATVAELMYLLRDHVDPATGETLIADATIGHRTSSEGP